MSSPREPPRGGAPARRDRRSLSHVGGAVSRGGDDEAAGALAHALDVEPAGVDEEEPERADVHGFHPYPARMHPTTASRLVEAFSEPGAVVLDPFCGSGTVLVEAQALGRAARGTDLNPVGLRLATLKTRAYTPGDLEALVTEARRLMAHADARRKARAGASRRYPPEDVALFGPHVLLELDSLRSGLDAMVSPAQGARHRETLSLVLSSLLVKLSNQRGDTSRLTETRRIAAGYTAKLFVRKTEELARRLAAFAARVSSPRAPVRVAQDDATRLTSLHEASVDAVITSPPYVATYDYLAHHELRMRWLGLDARPLELGELGARRRYDALGGAEAEEAWVLELTRLFKALGRVTRPGAKVVLLMADSAVAGRPLRADALVAEAAERAGTLVPEARASQERPHFHGPTARAFARQPREEHALLLRRAHGL